jgi:hypothetical protein
MCRIPIRIAADPEGISVTVHSADGWARPPSATLRFRGSPRPQPLPLTPLAAPGSFIGHVRGLPASSEGTIEVTGATAAGLPVSAIEEFSFARTERAIRLVGPGGHVRLDLKPARGETIVCIGPPGLDVLAFPRDAHLLGRAYAMTTTAEQFGEGAHLAFLVPNGAMGPDPAKVALCRWDGSWATWDRVDGAVRASDRPMVTADVTLPGVYAVIEQAGTKDAPGER